MAEQPVPSQEVSRCDVFAGVEARSTQHRTCCSWNQSQEFTKRLGPSVIVAKFLACPGEGCVSLPQSSLLFFLAQRAGALDLGHELLSAQGIVEQEAEVCIARGSLASAENP